jgi:hypothetical protein
MKPLAKALSAETWRMSRNAFIGDTLKYRKPHSCAYCPVLQCSLNFPSFVIHTT